MGTLAQAKTYGGVGAILLLLSPVPVVGFVLAIAGFILVLVAVKYISDSVGDRAIFDNMLYFVIAGIVGFLVAFFTVVIVVLPFLGPGFTPPTTPPDPGDLGALFAGVIIGLAIAWITLIVAGVFLRRSFDSISAHLGVGLFSTAALLYFIGAILVIVFVGLLLILIAEILMIAAFFSIPEEQPAPMMAAP